MKTRECNGNCYGGRVIDLDDPTPSRDWSGIASDLDDHRRAYEKLLTNYPPAQPIDEQTARQIEAHLDAIVGCCNQVDAWVANKMEA